MKSIRLPKGGWWIKNWKQLPWYYWWTLVKSYAKAMKFIFNTHFKGLISASLHSTSFRFLAARQAESLWSIVTKSVKKLDTKWYQSYFWKIKFKFWENLNSDKVLEDIWPNTAIARCWTTATKQRTEVRRDPFIHFQKMFLKKSYCRPNSVNDSNFMPGSWHLVKICQ